MSAASGTLKPVGEQVVLDRRHLHAHPELAFQEHDTARFIADRLQSHGLEVRTGVAQTGVVGLLRGGRPGRTVLLRADIDALPIQEENDVPYRSQRPDVMHACGHDGHTAILLNAARVLTERRERLAGNVKFMFQPSEERPPGGALPMIEQGVLDDPKVDAAFGLHVNAMLPTGTIAARAGATQAAADTFRIEITGQGGHAARPHLCVDTVLVAAQVVTALHTLVAREVNPIEPAVLTVGMLQAGTAPNVIPPAALLAGTVRTFDPELRQQMARRVEEVAAGIAGAMGAESRCEYSFGYPSVINDGAMTELVAEVARELVGSERVTHGERAMPADDFAYVLERVPGCYFRIGVSDPAGGPPSGNHHPRFDLDESALPLGVEMFVRVVERYLAE